ncbi:MAG: hypothetical protein GY725_22970 [bacterium]|nr:hypothetical protein [bacterium]
MHSRVLAFAGSLLSIYLVLIAPWPGISRAYAVAYRSAANVVASVLGVSHVTEVVELLDQDREAYAGRIKPRQLELNDTRLVFDTGRARRTVLHSAWHAGYVPTALLAALLLSTPIPWKKRLGSLLAGLLLLDVYLGLRIAATLLSYGPSSSSPWFPAGELRDSVLSALRFSGPGSGEWYLPPVLIWILVFCMQANPALIDGLLSRRSRPETPGRRT